MQPGYGPPGGGGYGAPGGGMAPAGPGGLGPKGTQRNPVTVTLISMFCCFYYGLFQCMKAEEEVNKFLGKSEGGSILWMLFPLIPALSMPKLIAEARAKAGTPTQGEGSLIMYILLPYYAFTKDVNELWGPPQQLAARPPANECGEPERRSPFSFLGASLSGSVSTDARQRSFSTCPVQGAA